MKKLIPLLAATSVLLAGTSYAQTPHTETDKISYSMGFKTGQAMKQRNVDIDPAVFAQALNDGYKGNTPKMSDKDMQSSLAAMQKKLIDRIQAKYKQAAIANAKSGSEFLAKNAKKPGIVTMRSGLQYKVITKGHGKSPTADNTVTVNYEGKLLNGKVFDSSYATGKPVSFKLNQVIKGWQEGLTKMKPGATWMLYIPSNLAYGKRGSFGKIGPNETLIFKVNLISVK